MKTVFFALLLPASVSFGQIKKTTPGHKPVAVKPSTSLSSTDSVSYSIGVQVASYYKAQGIEKVNPAFVQKAFNDVYNNKTLTISEEQCNMTIQQKLMEYMSKKSNVEKEAGKNFLEANKKRPGVITLPSGLQYEIIIKGTGAVPKSSDTVRANYIGTLIDGEEFDNSYKRGEPITIPVTGVIQGWVQALEIMPVGSKWKLYIPSELGYGDRGAGGVIPGGAALIFEMELLEIVNK